VSHEIAKQLAEKEFDKFRIIQDRLYESDFDKLTSKTIGRKKKNE